ncbi:MAG: hypothetical protein ACRD9Y_18065, partial [Blastocatellia bacterium]
MNGIGRTLRDHRPQDSITGATPQELPGVFVQNTEMPPDISLFPCWLLINASRAFPMEILLSLSSRHRRTTSENLDDQSGHHCIQFLKQRLTSLLFKLPKRFDASLTHNYT